MIKMREISTPVVFFPGTLCDERIFIPVWRKLNIAQRSYVPLQWADTLEQMMALACDRITAYEGKVQLVGFSMGGYIAALAAMQLPEKVASLTMIGYCPNGLSEQEVQQRKALIKMIDAKQPVALNKTRLAQFFTSTELDNAELIAPVKDMEADLGPSVLKAHIQSTTPRPDISKQLENSPFPIHFVVAEHDQVANPIQIKAHAESISSANFYQIDSTAHMMLLTKPEKLASHLETILV